MRGICRGTVGVFFRVALLVFCAGAGSAAAQIAGTLTLVEGRVALIRDATQYTAAPGVGLKSGDMLAVDPKGQAQVEFHDGAILNFSQGTRAMLTDIAAKRGARGQPVITLLSGWTKLTHAKSKGKPYRYSTPVAEIVSGDATAVLTAGGDFIAVFIESGTVKFYETGKRGARQTARDAKGGDFIARKGEQPATFSARPSPEFVKSMPRHFRDNLPVLLDRLKNRNVEPRVEHEVTYAEVEAWLKADYSIRRHFVTRFERRSRDPEFRRGLIDNLRAHPEWDRVLFPEKYEPKDPNDPNDPKRGRNQ
ncbi:MAG: hypothetical protein WBO23_05560 [Burkholderiales bacterium]